VPPGDPPGGTGSAFPTQQDASVRKHAFLFRSAGSPTGTGESPVLPIFQTGFELLQAWFELLAFLRVLFAE
jgi:hypothetical protein